MSPLLIRKLEMSKPLHLKKVESWFQDTNGAVFSIKSLNENDILIKNESGTIVLTKEMIEELQRFIYD